MNRKTILAFSIGPIGSALLSVITLPVVAWFFSIEDVGRLAMLQVAISFTMLLCSGGLDQAYAREYHECDDKISLLKHTMMPGLYILLITSFFVFILNTTLLSGLLFDLNVPSLSLLIIICLIGSYVSRFLSLLLRMQERGVAYSMSQLLPKVIFLCVVGFYVVYGVSKTFQNLLYAQVLSIVSVMLFFIWNTRIVWINIIKKRLRWSFVAPLLKFGIPLVFASLASWGLTTIDRVVLRSMSTYHELGLYSIAASVGGIATIFAGLFNTLWMPTVYKWVATNDNLDAIHRVSEHVLAAVYFVFVIFGMFSWLIPYFFPQEYFNLNRIIIACAAGPLLYTLSETTGVGIGITRKTGYAMVASTLALLASGAGSYMLVPVYGAAGAAASTALAFFLFFVIRTEIACLVWTSRPRKKLYLSMTACVALAVYAAIWSIHYEGSIIWISCFLFFIGIFMFSNSLRLLNSELLMVAHYMRAYFNR